MIRFTLSYHKLCLRITPFNSVLFTSTENRRTRSFSSIDFKAGGGGGGGAVACLGTWFMTIELGILRCFAEN